MECQKNVGKNIEQIGFLPLFTTMSKRASLLAYLSEKWTLLLLLWGKKENGSEICDDFFGSCHKGLWHPAITQALVRHFSIAHRATAHHLSRGF